MAKQKKPLSPEQAEIKAMKKEKSSKGWTKFFAILLALVLAAGVVFIGQSTAKKAVENAGGASAGAATNAPTSDADLNKNDVQADVGEELGSGEAGEEGGDGVTKENIHEKFNEWTAAAAKSTYKFNRVGWDNAPDVDALMAMNAAALAELGAQLQAKESENAQLKNQLAASKNALTQAQNKVKQLENEPKFMDAAQSVFFAFNSSKIESKKEIINLKSLAEAAKNAGVKLSVVGYADNATGSAAYNQKLSEARANAVAEKLVELGVSRDQLIVVGKGGVAEEKPARLNRRVIISVAK